jgi:hypothetical protein
VNQRRWAIAVWVLLLVSYTFAAGFAIPPRQGTADPDAEGPGSAAQLERLLEASSDGTDRYSLTPSTVAHGPAELAVMVAPERSPYPTETQVVDDFMQDGGTLVVFAATTAWNSFLADYRIRLDGSTLLPTGNTTSENLLTLDLPASLGSGELLVPNATRVLADDESVRTFTPEGETVLDRNGNGTIEAGDGRDEAGSFPIAAQTDVGDGQLVVVASSEAVLGAGLERQRHLGAVTNLVETLGEGGPAALDVGTHPRGWNDLARAPAAATLSVAQASPYGLGLLALVGAGLIAATPARPQEDEIEGGLDELTDVTREVMLDRGD